MFTLKFFKNNTNACERREKASERGSERGREGDSKGEGLGCIEGGGAHKNEGGSSLVQRPRQGISREESQW